MTHEIEGRNSLNLTEPHSTAVNAENVSVKQILATNRDENKMPDVPENLSDKSALSCQRMSTQCTTCTNADCDCASRVSVKKDDTEEGNKDVKKAHGNIQDAHWQDSSSNSESGFDPDESAKHKRPKTKHVVITVTRIGPATEEAKAEEQAGEEEGKGAEEDSEEAEEKRDAFPDFSSQHHQHHRSTEDTSPNISITSALANNPPPGSSVSRATFSPGSPTDKQIQLPALFSSLRVLRKGVFGPESDTVAHVKPSSQGAKRTIYSEKQGDAKVQGSFLEQISQFLNREKKGDENEEKKEVDTEGDLEETRETNETEESQESPERNEPEKDEDTEALFESTKPPVSSAEAAFDAFKAFFTPKPLKKDPAVEKVDLEAMRKKRQDKDTLRAFFERTSSKTSEKKDSSDGKVCIALPKQSFRHIMPT